MKRVLMFVALACISLSTYAAKPKFEVKHLEPLSWWVGMTTPLQLMVNAEGVSAYDVAILPEGQGVELKAVHKADSPNYLFLDVAKAQEIAAERDAIFIGGSNFVVAEVL